MLVCFFLLVASVFSPLFFTPPSLPTNIISLSCVVLSIVTLPAAAVRRVLELSLLSCVSHHVCTTQLIVSFLLKNELLVINYHVVHAIRTVAQGRVCVCVPGPSSLSPSRYPLTPPQPTETHAAHKEGRLHAHHRSRGQGKTPEIKRRDQNPCLRARRLSWIYRRPIDRSTT